MDIDINDGPATGPSLNSPTKVNFNYLFRVAAVLEEIASRYRNAKVFTPVDVNGIIAELDQYNSPRGLSHRLILSLWCV
jgi:hypothetical protein